MIEWWIDHDILLPEETRIIDELKKICGNVFVSKLDSLAKDAISSKEFALFIQEVIKEWKIIR